MGKVLSLGFTSVISQITANTLQNRKDHICVSFASMLSPGNQVPISISWLLENDLFKAIALFDLLGPECFGFIRVFHKIDRLIIVFRMYLDSIMSPDLSFASL